jgi:hypothetical protein
MEHLLEFAHTCHMQTPIRPHDHTDVPLINGEWTDDRIGEHEDTRTRWVFPKDARTDWAQSFY